ncbi:DUF6086 family protein [Amycolatopsis taiwanensis]|uniref:Uncharacterized protein n=1 Tax=Amycolatopsis taiwanensis TaxID=342230 RepID=A0A9W6QVD2_9PSEU|nr:DUF6086 family protein [Amycolatopsis taiwanensis]GLY63645.1 hypothetical protein Atai01_02640 [Amycolatopsis taiwanensis]
MGMLFTVDGQEVWDRGLATSQVFYGQIALLEKYVVGQPSGLYDTGCDEVQVAPAVFREFLRAAFVCLDSFKYAPICGP